MEALGASSFDQSGFHNRGRHASQSHKDPLREQDLQVLGVRSCSLQDVENG
jgi:hypothetical protein